MFLIKFREWEKQTGQKWPEIRTREMNQNNEIETIIRRYDAHEIIPNQYGGPLKWYNITPAKGGTQHQGGIHGKGSILNSILKDVK